MFTDGTNFNWLTTGNILGNALLAGLTSTPTVKGASRIESAFEQSDQRRYHVPCPHCGEPMDLFGRGGGDLVAEQLTKSLGTAVPVLGRIPFDVRLREGGDNGQPLVTAVPDAHASLELRAIAEALSSKPRGLVGQSLGLSPSRKN